jgi:selenium donor protein
LCQLPPIEDPAVLVGTSTADDAAVYRIDDQRAIIQTVDFITPIVDDPYDFGRIAAANSISDVYAMGGRPLFALNIVCFPSKKLPLDVLGTILKGGCDKAREAGIEIVGGHSVDDAEPKYGLVVTGMVSSDRVLTNARNLGPAKPRSPTLTQRMIAAHMNGALKSFANSKKVSMLAPV